MTTRAVTRTVAAGLGVATAAAVLVGIPSSQALSRANNTVTIQAEGTDLSGTVKSKFEICKNERKVLVVKQKGTKGGDDDIVMFRDTTELVDGVGQWNTGNTGVEGRFYAKIKRTANCKAAVSETVRAVRSND